MVRSSLFLFLFLSAVLIVAPLGAQPHPSGPLAFGAVSGRPGEVVEVSMTATFDQKLLAYSILFQYDRERIEFVGFTIEGTAAAGFNPLALYWSDYGNGDGLLGIGDDGRGTAGEGFVVLPGEDRTLAQVRFRILASADEGAASVTPVTTHDSVMNQTNLSILEEWGGTVGSHPEPLLPGSVTVLPPFGPRPVGGFRCVQFLDRVKLTFVPTEQYDAIVLSRDGSEIAVLPGDAREHADPLPGIGAYRYSAVAVKGGVGSIAAACELTAVSPAAPPVEDLTCGDSGLAWKNPIAYEGITVLRNGEEIARLPGAAESYIDPGRPDALTIYTVACDLEGFRSPDVNCLDHGIWMMEVGDVRVDLDAKRVSIPIYGTSASPAQGIGLCLQIDPDRFRYIEDNEAALEGAMGPYPFFFASGYIGPCGGPTIGIMYDSITSKTNRKFFPVGLRQRIANFIFEPLGTFSDGEVFTAALINAEGACVFTVEGKSNYPDLIPGQVRFGSGGTQGVKGLRATDGAAGGGDAGSDVSLEWENASAYDAIRIERNGEPIAELPGDSTGFLDGDVPRGAFTYKVIAVEGGREAFPATAFLSTVSPPGAFLRSDANRDGRINLSDPVFTLNFLFRGGPAPPCEDAADADDDGRITMTDPVVTLQHLFLGMGVGAPAKAGRAPGTEVPWFDPTPDGLGCRS